MICMHTDGRRRARHLKLQLYSAMQGVASTQEVQPVEQGMQTYSRE